MPIPFGLKLSHDVVPAALEMLGLLIVTVVCVVIGARVVAR
jgi:hypothetical protein